MNSDRIKEIQQATAYPESRSVHQALLKVWNETAQGMSKEPPMSEGSDEATCYVRDCSYFMGISKEEALKELSSHEGTGTMVDYMKRVAPDYVDGTDVLKFTLVKDMGWDCT